MEENYFHRDICSIAEDFQHLQANKPPIGAKYDHSFEAKTNTFDELARLKKQSEKLTEELNKMEGVAHNVETKAISSLDALHEYNSTLKLKLNESKRRILGLGSLLKSNREDQDLKMDNLPINVLQMQLQNGTDKGNRVINTK